MHYTKYQALNNFAFEKISLPDIIILTMRIFLVSRIGTVEERRILYV